jgi:hypothetical protein
MCEVDATGFPWTYVNVMGGCSAGSGSDGSEATRTLATSGSLADTALEGWTVHHVWSQGFDADQVRLGEVVCTAQDPAFDPAQSPPGAPPASMCEIMQPESIAMFAGSASYYPVGIYCNFEACVGVTWEG